MVAYGWKKNCNCGCPLGGCEFGGFARSVRVTGFATADGGETSWSLDGTYSQRWKAGLAGAAVGVYNMQGFDIDTHAPDVEHETWAAHLLSSGFLSFKFVPYTFRDAGGGVSMLAGGPLATLDEKLPSNQLSAPLLDHAVTPHFGTTPINGIKFPLHITAGFNVRVSLTKFALIKDGVVGSTIYTGPTGYVTGADASPLAIFKPSTFDVPTKPSFTRGVRYGLRIWLKLEVMAVNASADVYIGCASSLTATQAGTRTDISHGESGTYLAFNVDTNPTFDCTKHSYQFEYVGGTERPFGNAIDRFWRSSSSGDSQTPIDPSAPNSGYLSANTWLNRCSAARMKVSHGANSNPSIGLVWYTEVPIAMVSPAAGTQRYYIPEDSLDYISEFEHNNLSAVLTYYRAENPAGIWNGKDEKVFVPLFAIQSNTTGIFTPSTWPISAPTSVKVKRIPY